MSDADIDVRALPEKRRTTFGAFAELLTALAGDNLLGLCAFGGWVVDDPAYQQAPASSVLVLRETDLRMLERLAARGSRFRRQGVGAPLIMTPEYIQASGDVFPLELLEIQQLHVCACGTDYFSDLKFAPADLRLQCERELKSELIHLRQGLIATAGRHNRLHDVCIAAAERSIRVVRGVLHLLGREVPQFAHDVLEAAAGATGLKLVTLARAVVAADRLGFEDFQRCYAEVAALAHYVDQFADQGQPAAGAQVD